MNGEVPPSPATPTRYRRQRVVFGTRHGKEKQVVRAFETVLDAGVWAVPDLDTDQFGTFTGDVARTLAPVDSAVAKARLAMSVASEPLGLASEGSYGALNGIPVTVHDEILVFVDDALGIEVVEGERNAHALPAPQHVRRVEDFFCEPSSFGFPSQGLVVRPAVGDPADTHKGVTDAGVLADVIATAASRSADGLAVVEPDLRAHHNPTRQAVLRRLGWRMARRLATACPVCLCPGYGWTSVRRGLPCDLCATPTAEVDADVLTCPRCIHTSLRRRASMTADPKWCERCNP